MRIASIICSLLLVSLLGAGVARAQETKPKTNVAADASGGKVSNPKDPVAKDPIKKPGRPGPDPFALTPEREAAAMTFVKQHHPELAELVRVLKESRPREYQKAIRDLYRASERLADLQQIDLQRYDLELKAWRNQSRLQLLVARVQMAPGDEKLQAELKAELAHQYNVRLEMLELERLRITDRMSKLDAQIEKLKEGREAQIERQLSELLGKKVPGKPGKPMKKPVAKP